MTMSDPWRVRRVGKRAVVVKHPVGGPRFYRVADPDDFWAKPTEEQRKTAIRRYWEDIDPEKTDPDVDRVLYRDAQEAGAFDDQDGDADA